MNDKRLKVSSVLLGLILILPITFSIWGLGSAEEVYEEDGNEHLVSTFTIPVESIDGVIGDEWPDISDIGHLWCTSEEEPVGDVYIAHDEDMLYIGALATYTESQMAEDGHWVKIDWNRDTVMDFTDHMGNSQDVIFQRSIYGFEYQIPLDDTMMVDNRVNILLHAKLLGIPSEPDGETTTFPYRPPGKFLCTTLVLLPPEPNVPPEANMDFTINSFTVTFDGSGSFDVDGIIVEYSWNFGDGGFGTGMSQTHTYTGSGDYSVTLTVTDNDGASDTETCTLTIVNELPVAVAGEDQTVYRFETVYLDGSASFDIDGLIIGYTWDFGDGNVGYSMSPVHSYQYVGEYQVSLTVKDDKGETSSDTCQISVIDTPDVTYYIEYLAPADETIVDGSGIHFYTSGSNPGLYHLIPYNETFEIPEEDYGTYFLYNSTTPIQYSITVRNDNEVVLTDVVVSATQERHNDVTIWDSCGEIALYKGQILEGDSTTYWVIDELAPGTETTLYGYYCFEGRGWGLDQTHLKIMMGGTTIVDDPEAGVYCPP